MPRPYRAKIFFCPVGRGDPTPPQTPQTTSGCPKGSRLRKQKHHYFVKFGFHVGISGKTSFALNSVPSRYISKWQWLPKEYPVLPT